ncbi:hypothetical protein ACTNEO_14310 [Gracilibacillus sp. HCP3S3_G5_1]|uniref:hypothetical protein n=1 Tax=unclassified Gracilibacillus TaxID=2625209 RepID=UPI003F89D52E
MKDPTKESIKVYEDENYSFSFKVRDNYKENQEETRKELANTIAEGIKEYYKTHPVNKDIDQNKKQYGRKE